MPQTEIKQTCAIINKLNMEIMNNKKSWLLFQKLFLRLKGACVCFHNDVNVKSLKLKMIYSYSRLSFIETIKNELCLMNIGRIFYEEFWGKISQFD